MEPDELRTADKYGSQSLTQNQILDRPAGYGVISGGEVNTASNPYSLTVSDVVGQFGVAVGADGGIVQNTVEGAATSIDLLRYVDDQDPRKVVIALSQPEQRILVLPEQPDGPATGEDGSAEPAIPEGNTRWKTERPAPVDLHGRTDVLPLAAVWVGANVTEIVGNDIRDRRLVPSIEAAHVHSGEIRFGTLIDGAGVEHSGELADRTDIPTVEETRQRIQTNATHGSDANHNYYTDEDTLSIVNAQEVLSVDIDGRADTVDGYHGTELAKTGHNHDNRYLNDRDGTVTESNLAFDPFTQTEYQQSLDEVLVQQDVTLAGGSNPAAVATLDGVTDTVSADLGVDVSLAADPGFDAGFSYEWGKTWDTSSNAWTVEVVISWAETPVDGDNATATVEVTESGDNTTPLSVEGEAINPASVTTNSVDTDELSGGVTNNQPLTNIPFQDGDKVILDTAVYMGTNKSTTSTTYQNAYSTVQGRGILAGEPFIGGLDYSTHYVRLVSVMYNGTQGETVSHRLANEPAAECTHTGDGSFPAVASPMIERPPSGGGPIQFTTELSVSGGTGHAYATEVQLIGEL